MVKIKAFTNVNVLFVIRDKDDFKVIVFRTVYKSFYGVYVFEWGKYLININGILNITNLRASLKMILKLI